ncbi:hypothetical protein [Paenibacillus sp.]|uniref:hypothetical protein n=1 Tax=Paenibacillus sp. TaxID=58172 RepID=UPI002D250EDC|nr:hypothetical protein [Paenibacillus sp.]HZG88429.1 hypothetical protein [Paenibacillus sp.]
MNLKRRLGYAMLLAALAASLTACMGTGGGADEQEQPPAASEEAGGAERPAGDDAGQPTAEETEQPSEEAEQPKEAPAEQPAGEPANAADLPQTAELEISVEGEAANVPASLTTSEQGYAFYLMDGFEFAMEEPGKDLIFHADFPEYYARVEMLPADVDVESIKTSSTERLKAVGDVVEMTGDEVHSSVRGREAFFLHASTSELSQNIVLLKGNGTYFLVTLNFPNGEAAEGVTPRFYPMLNSLVAVR